MTSDKTGVYVKAFYCPQAMTSALCVFSRAVFLYEELVQSLVHVPP